MSRDALDIFRVLQAHRVPFVIIGGHAVAFHGYLRNTEDFDAVWVRSPESELHLFQALTELEAHWISNEVDLKTSLERLVPVSQAFIRNEHLMMLWTRNGLPGSI